MFRRNHHHLFLNALVVLRIVDGRNENRVSETGSSEILLSLLFLDWSAASRDGMAYFLMTGEEKFLISFGESCCSCCSQVSEIRLLCVLFSSGSSVWVTSSAKAVVWITDLLMDRQQRILSGDLFIGHRGSVWNRTWFVRNG